MKISRANFLRLLRENGIAAQEADLEASRRLDELGLNWFDFALFVAALEEEFGVAIDEQDLDGIGRESSVGQLCGALRHLGLDIEL